ncbi:MAG TPA: 1-(5-phosphoribosyl)-5-[(5-phosphoribosylamino)methylideneamino] imidazole-4-carboxamide isomerase [Actinomycetota bacterium]|nr:1-(5-phosphoribosyl)-5-[(5-phosphoribosylamino)methylideneamino] imidazole-4-carboxamide isomerase [Actinomycetota bacterium]
MIVIPAIDIRGGRCVRLVEGDPSRQTVYDADPVAVARRFVEQGASWLHVVDLDAAFGSGSNGDAITAICREAPARIQVGGGLRTDPGIEAAIRAGADRIVLGTAATDPTFVRRQVERHGNAVAVAVDVRDGRAMTEGWQAVGPRIEDLFPRLDDAGCPRYLVTAIVADGRLTGPDLALYERVRSLTDRPILASGGVSSADDLRALSELELEGAVVGKALHEGRLTLADAVEAVAS